MLKPDLKLLRDHGTTQSYSHWKEKNGINTTDGFCFKFIGASKILYYVGTKHTNDDTSDTFTYIRKCIKSRHPDIVVVEGIPYSRGMNPKLTNLQNESKCAIETSITENINYIGIECDEKNILKKISKKYSIDDIYGFYFLRDWKIALMARKISEEQFRKEFVLHGKKYLDSIFGEKPWNPDVWFKNTFDKEFIYNDTSSVEHASPRPNSDIITQKISYKLSRLRDTCNIHNLYEIMNQPNHHCILYIMGQNHVYADFNVLAKTFQKIKLMPKKKLDKYLFNPNYVFYCSNKNNSSPKISDGYQSMHNALINGTLVDAQCIDHTITAIASIGADFYHIYMINILQNKVTKFRISSKLIPKLFHYLGFELKITDK